MLAISVIAIILRPPGRTDFMRWAFPGGPAQGRNRILLAADRVFTAAFLRLDRNGIHASGRRLSGLGRRDHRARQRREELSSAGADSSSSP